MTTTADTPSASPAASPAVAPAVDLAAVVDRQVTETIDVKRKFFDEHRQKVCDCAVAMAEAFNKGGRVYVFGNGGSSCDAVHTSVEFMHPIIEKRPALPAVALTSDTAVLTAVGNDQDFSLVYAEQLRMLGRAGDMAIGISTSGKSANILRALKWAGANGLMTIGFAGRDGGKMPPACDHCFVVPSYSIPRIQEAHQTLLHIIWDLIHIHRGEEDVL